MIRSEYYTLSNGVQIPRLGLGTWFIEDANVAQVVRDAVELGYCHVDTAQAYENEAGVGLGVRSCGLRREQLFVTTKLAAEIKTYDEAVKAIEGSLNAMQLDYIDLMRSSTAPGPGRISAGRTPVLLATGKPGGRWRMRIRPASCGPLVCPTFCRRIWKTCWPAAVWRPW